MAAPLRSLALGGLAIWRASREVLHSPRRVVRSSGSIRARRASRVPAPPGEQQIGIDAVALCNLRHGRARREALGNHPPLLIARPEPTPMRSLSDSQLDPPAPASSIAPIIVDGHYPRATPRPLSLPSASRPGGLRRTGRRTRSATLPVSFARSAGRGAVMARRTSAFGDGGGASGTSAM